MIGGWLITVSGVVNAYLGIKIGATLYDAYPGGKMGHVGIVAGIGAFAIGLVIAFVLAPLYRRTPGWPAVFGGLLTIVLGHLGAIAGALYVGTAGVLLCYTAGVWAMLVGVPALRRGHK
jgi:hypothetical protein